MPAEALVTIAIPTFSRHAYLRESIASASAQTHPNLEILVSDDGDEPITRVVADAARRQDPRVRYWKNTTKPGLARNWNRCLDEANGEYIIIIGDDDRLLPDAIATLLDKTTEDVVFANHFLIDKSGRRLSRLTEENTRRYRRDRITPGPIPNPEPIVWSNSIPASASLVRTLRARSLRFKEDVNTPELILFAELAQQGAKFRFVGDYVSEYRVHGGSSTAAGLWNDKLARHLLRIPVSPETDETKRELMQPLLASAVDLCLRNRNHEEAKNLASSEYYPKNKIGPPKLLAQRFCLALPAPLGCGAYSRLRSFQRVNQTGQLGNAKGVRGLQT